MDSHSFTTDQAQLLEKHRRETTFTKDLVRTVRTLNELLESRDLSLGEEQRAQLLKVCYRMAKRPGISPVAAKDFLRQIHSILTVEQRTVLSDRKLQYARVFQDPLKMLASRRWGAGGSRGGRGPRGGPGKGTGKKPSGPPGRQGFPAPDRPSPRHGRRSPTPYDNPFHDGLRKQTLEHLIASLGGAVPDGRSGRSPRGRGGRSSPRQSHGRIPADTTRGWNPSFSDEEATPAGQQRAAAVGK